MYNKLIYTFSIVLFMATSVLSQKAVKNDVVEEIPELRVIQANNKTLTNMKSGTDVHKSFKDQNISYVIWQDSTYIENPETGKRELQVSERRQTLDEYYREFGKERFKRLEERVRYIKEKSGLPKETIVYGMNKNNEEDQDVITKRNNCYQFRWGKFIFSDEHIIDIFRLKKLMDSRIELVKPGNSPKCEGVKSYSCRVVFVTPDGDIRYNNINEDSTVEDMQRIDESIESEILEIYIEDVSVNSVRIIDGIVLKVRPDSEQEPF